MGERALDELALKRGQPERAARKWSFGDLERLQEADRLGARQHGHSEKSLVCVSCRNAPPRTRPPKAFLRLLQISPRHGFSRFASLTAWARIDLNSLAVIRTKRCGACLLDPNSNASP